MARKFKTKEELQINKKTYLALHWVRRMLKDGKLRHKRYRNTVLNGHANVFNMAVGNAHSDEAGHECGTVGCIGGWAAIHMLGIKPGKNGIYPMTEQVSCTVGTRMNWMERENHDLRRLFYPDWISTPANSWPIANRKLWDLITRADAWGVLDTYLRTGVVDWDKVLTKALALYRAKYEATDSGY